jgi:hypothetical protein
MQMIKDGDNQAWTAAITDKKGNIRPDLIYSCIVYSIGNVLACDFDMNMEWKMVELLRKRKADADKTTYTPTPPHLQFSTMHVENKEYTTIQGWYQVDPNKQLEFPEDKRYTFGLISTIDASTTKLASQALDARQSFLKAPKFADGVMAERERIHGDPARVTELLASEGRTLSVEDLVMYTEWPTDDATVHQGSQKEILNAVRICLCV